MDLDGGRFVKLLVAGAGGMLGSAVVDAFESHEVTTAGRDRLDVRRPGEVAELVRQARPDVVINCAAHTDVEGAERDLDAAFAANALLPGLLATAARQARAVFVHISSTGCYGDWKSEPYIEADPLRPTTAHHRSKAAGEEAVRHSGAEHLILRTGWLYGGPPAGAKNFVWRRLIEARGADRITSDASQHGVPTFAPAVAGQIAVLLEAGVRGTFNVTAQGSASRFEYVAEIVRRSGLPCRVEPGPAFKRLAAVSPNETARNYSLGLLGLDRMADWREPLAAYVAELLRSSEWRSDA